MTSVSASDFFVFKNSRAQSPCAEMSAGDDISAVYIYIYLNHRAAQHSRQIVHASRAFVSLYMRDLLS